MLDFEYEKKINEKPLNQVEKNKHKPWEEHQRRDPSPRTGRHEIDVCTDVIHNRKS